MMDKKQLDSILFGGATSSGSSPIKATPTKTSSGRIDSGTLDDMLFGGTSVAPPATGFGAISAQDYASKTKEKLSWWEQVKQGADNFKESFYEAQPEPLQAVMRGADAVGNAGQKLVKGAATMATGVVRGIGRAAVGATKSTVANTVGYAQEALTGDDSIREAALAPVNIPFLGNVKGYSANPEDVEKYGAANAKETAGDAAEAALDAASLYSGGALSSKTAKTFGGAVAKGAGVGGLFGWANGTAMAMQNDENLEDVIKNGLFSGLVGTVFGGVLGGATNLEKLKTGQASPETAASLTHRKDLLDEYKRISSDPERARRLNAAVEAGDMDTQQRVLGERLYKQAEQLDDAAQKQWRATELKVLEKHADDLVSKVNKGKSIIPSINYGIRDTLSDEGVKVSTKGVLNFEGSKLQGMSNKGLQRDLQSLVDDMMAEPKSVADIVNRRAALGAAGSKFAKDPNAYRVYKGLTEAFDASLDRRLLELGTDLGAMRADFAATAGPAKKVLKALTGGYGEVDVDKAASYVRVAMSDARFNKAQAIADIDELAGTDFLKDIKMLGAIQVLDKAHTGKNAPGVAAMIMSVGKRYADKLSAGVIGDATRPDVWKQVLIDKGINPKLADTAARKATYDMLQLIGRQVISKVAGSLAND